MTKNLLSSALVLVTLSCAHAGGGSGTGFSGREAVVPAVFDFTVVDRSRADPLDATRPRTWRVFLYYPAVSRSERAPGAYATDAALLARLKGLHYYELSDADLDAWSALPGPVVDRAAPARAGRRPLLTLSPGFGVVAFNYSLLAAELVQRGFVVAVIDHPYLGLSHLEDGRFVSYEDEPLFRNEDLSLWAPRIADWARDVAVTLDRLERSPVRGLDYDLRHVVAAGHSSGGGIALDACRNDPRVVACADFEGSPEGTVTAQQGPAKPALFVLSRSVKPERPQTRPDFANPVFKFLAQGGRASAWAVSVAGGGHMSFSDAPAVMPSTLTRFGGTVMSATRSFEVYAGMLAAFSAAYGDGGGGDPAFAAFLASVPEARAAHAEKSARAE